MSQHPTHNPATDRPHHSSHNDNDNNNNNDDDDNNNNTNTNTAKQQNQPNNQTIHDERKTTVPRSKYSILFCFKKEGKPH